MLFKLTHPLPPVVVVACSGGADSVAALHWLQQSRRVSAVVHVNHGTGVFAEVSSEFVKRLCKLFEVPCDVLCAPEVPPGENAEAFWRDFRYRVFKGYNEPVVTAHTLDDCVEELVFSNFVRGFSGVIPYRHANVIRPFRTWQRSSIIDYLGRHDVPYLTDPTNSDTSRKRSYIRHEIVPKLKELNPGLYKVVATKILKEAENADSEPGDPEGSPLHAPEEPR